MHLSGTYTSNEFVIVTDASGNTEVNFACFLRGTRIASPAGEVAVELLRIGDEVTLASGEARPVKWIGRRAYNGVFAHRNPNVLPVCLRAGALADGVPSRDLYGSRKHAMYVDDLLIHAIELVNGILTMSVPEI